jgi:hypothetical protein
MPEEPAYHVPPSSTLAQRNAIRLRITVCLAAFGMALFIVVTSLLTVISRLALLRSASLPLSGIVMHDGIITILLAGAAVLFSVVSYRAGVQQRRYLAGKATATQAKRSMITLAKASIIIPALTVIAYGFWILIDIFFISGVPG